MRIDFQYSIGDADLVKAARGGVAPGLPFQYSIGDAVKNNKGQTPLHLAFNTPLEMRAYVPWQRLVEVFAFNTPLEMR